MTDKEKLAIERLKKIDETTEEYDGNLFKADFEIVLNLIEKQQAEIEKKDNIVKAIIKRLDNDIKNIAETKANKRYLDDYTRCRLKAYRTKTREIKDYIEEKYFKKKVNSSEQN